MRPGYSPHPKTPFLPANFAIPKALRRGMPRPYDKTEDFV